MSNLVTEYKNQFKNDTIELVVHISWCIEKGSSKPSMLENHYKVQARFDKGIDVKTGKTIEGQGLNWLEWLAPKKLFGYSYGYKLKKGINYRLLVREYISKDKVEYKKYYVEKVLEENVKEPRLDSVYQFENKYEEHIYDFNVLVKDGIHSWATLAGYRMPATTFIAYVDNDSGCIYENYGKLTWIEKKANPLCILNLRKWKCTM